MRIGIAQINTTVGDIPGNSDRIIAAYKQLCSEGAELVVFSELVITGYPPRDLLFKQHFVPDNEKALLKIAQHADTIPILLGFVETNTEKVGRNFHNAAAWCRGGQVYKIFRKSLLPSYDVFDEDRYFQPAERPECIQFKGIKIGVTICEDIWTHPIVETRHRYQTDPLKILAEEKVDLIINLSASPWHNEKNEIRTTLITDAASQCHCPVVYCNLVGGNDELIFDGRSLVANEKGDIICAMEAFQEDLKVVDMEDQHSRIAPTYMQSEMKDIREALVLGLRDYVHKCGFKKALIGLSGGIDSAVTAVIAQEALGAENVFGISLPSSISSQHSQDDARDLAENLGIKFHYLPIADVVQASEKTLQTLFEGQERDVTEENIQARARGLLLMALSNKYGALLLTTGNKSELAVGYCTLYGDMCGGLAVISDLPKIKVYDLARHINRKEEIIPNSTITKPPSAELRPDQKDEDSLPPYDVLDAILKAYVEEGRSRADIAAMGYDPEIVNDVVRKVDLNEYKRKQAAPGLKITPLAFGVGRRIPIVQKYVH
ncbi:MAG: NAD+ synthase [Verrucomicrobia bacterium]|nr:NAD+ synthase [Verrucomicrobiota bacterium]